MENISVDEAYEQALLSKLAYDDTPDDTDTAMAIGGTLGEYNIYCSKTYNSQVISL